jgi:hypothetical protein
MRSALKMRTALRTAPKPTDAATAATGGAHASAARESESVALAKAKVEGGQAGRRDGARRSRLLASLRRDSFRRSSEFECAEYETTTPTYLFIPQPRQETSTALPNPYGSRAVQRRQQS